MFVKLMLKQIKKAKKMTLLNIYASESPCEVGINIPIAHMEEVRLREFPWCVQGHMVRNGRMRNKTRPLVSKSGVFLLYLYRLPVSCRLCYFTKIQMYTKKNKQPVCALLFLKKWLY